MLNFCNGGDLYYLLSRCKKFKESQARFYAGEVFLAIQHLREPLGALQHVLAVMPSPAGQILQCLHV